MKNNINSKYYRLPNLKMYFFLFSEGFKEQPTLFMILNLEVSSCSTTKSYEINKPFNKIKHVGFIITDTWVW